VTNQKRGLKQKFFDLAVVLTVLAGLTMYAFQKGRLSFTQSDDIPSPPLPSPTAVIPNEPQIYKNDEFSFQFTYSPKSSGCSQQISVSEPWIMNETVNGVSVYCNENKNLIQILTEKTDKNITDWWYSLLPDNEAFLEQNGEMKDITFQGIKAKEIAYRKNNTNDHFNQLEIAFQNGGVNYLIVALDYLCNSDKVCWQGDFEQHLLKNFKLTDGPNLTPLPTNPVVQICGGILGKICPDGFTCKYDGNYPDATGSCVKN